MYYNDNKRRWYLKTRANLSILITSANNVIDKCNFNLNRVYNNVRNIYIMENNINIMENTLNTNMLYITANIKNIDKQNTDILNMYSYDHNIIINSIIQFRKLYNVIRPELSMMYAKTAILLKLRTNVSNISKRLYKDNDTTKYRKLKIKELVYLISNINHNCEKIMECNIPNTLIDITLKNMSKLTMYDGCILVANTRLLEYVVKLKYDIDYCSYYILLDIKIETLSNYADEIKSILDEINTYSDDNLNTNVCFSLYKYANRYTRNAINYFNDSLQLNYPHYLSCNEYYENSNRIFDNIKNTCDEINTIYYSLIKTNSTDQHQNNRCSICFDELNEYAYNYTKTICDHSYHEPCILKWYDTSQTCPICRDSRDAIYRNQ